jgi:hypothetical protein
VGDSSFRTYLSAVPALIVLASGVAIIVWLCCERRSFRIICGMWLTLLALAGILIGLSNILLSLILFPLLGLIGITMVVITYISNT